MTLVLIRTMPPSSFAHVPGYDSPFPRFADMSEQAIDSSHWPTPLTVLRQGAFLSFAGAGVSVIVAARTHAPWARELSSYLLCPLLVFVMFWAEYKIVEGVIKRPLNLRLGHLQSLGCVAVALYGVACIAATGLSEASSPAGLAERVLLLLCLFGESVFVANVVVTYNEANAQQRQRLAIPVKPPPLQAGQRVTPQLRVINQTAGNSDWPNSAAGMFGIAAMFFAVMGIILTKIGFLGSQVPLQWNGSTMQVTAGYLWISTALPFAIFALIYLVLEMRAGQSFPQSTTRAHFICILLAVLEAIHVYLGWATTWTHPDPISSGNFGGAFAFAILGIACFAWNVVASRRSSV